MFRSGESEFFINKRPCRLKDITYLFLNTGIGAHAYSVIEQGMVENLLSDDPDLRRRLFEEAAGTAKYRVQRQAALRKLEATAADLLRLSDILKEVERQRSGLRRQVRRAEVYERWRGQIRDAELQLAAREYAKLGDQERALREELARVEAEQRNKRDQLAEREAAAEELKRLLATQEGELTRLQISLEEISRQAAEIDAEIRVRRERRSSTEEEQARIEQEMGSALHRLQELQQHSRALGTELERTREDLLRTERKEREDEQELLVQEEDLKQERDRLRDRRTALLSLRAREEEKRRVLAIMQARRQSLGEGRKRAADEKAVLSSDGERIRTAITETAHRLQEEQTARALLQKRLDRLLKTRAGLDAARERHERAIGQLQQEHEISRSEVELLRNIQERFEDYPPGVQVLLGPEGGHLEGIRGVLANLIEVPSEWIGAVEAALGDWLECVVVDSLPSAREAIRFLREGRRGRARFLSLAPEPGPPDRSVRAEARAIRVADLVRCEPVYRPIVERLLADMLAVEGPEELSRAVEDGWGGRIVTREGDLWGGPGILAGGADPEDRQGPLAKRQRIAVLDARIERLKAEIGKTSHLLALVGQRGEWIRGRTGAVEEELRQGLERGFELEKKSARLSYEEETLRSRLDAVRAEDARLARETALLDGEQTSAEEELKRVVGDREADEQALQTLESTLDASERVRQELASRLGELRIRLIELRTLEASRQREIGRAEAEAGEIVQGQERRQGLQVELGEKLRRWEKEIAELEEHLAGLTGRRARAAEEREAHTERSRETARRLEETQKLAAELRTAVESDNEEIHSLRLRRSEISLEMAHVVARARETHESDLPAVADAEGTVEEDMLRQSAQILRDKLKRIGGVNLAALGEFQAVDERRKFLCRQRDDLVAAKDDLQITITKIDETARSMFLETFSRIRQGFAAVFSRLLPGGEADLELIGSDPLESEIAILARPQGKRLRSIDLLSGGERSLTAISLLMSVYLTRPAPFCILDEIDAPLDDANVGRFLDLLNEFSQNTQFVVITHNKKTMEAADALYGVTMQEPGVSRVVSVRLNRRERSADRIAVEAAPEQ
jgi:chromosome segregation protein